MLTRFTITNQQRETLSSTSLITLSKWEILSRVLLIRYSVMTQCRRKIIKLDFVFSAADSMLSVNVSMLQPLSKEKGETKYMENTQGLPVL